MSRYYEMTVEISGHDPEKAGPNPGGGGRGVAV